MDTSNNSSFIHFSPYFKPFAIGASIFWLSVFLIYTFFIKEPDYIQTSTNNQTLIKTLNDSSSVFLNYNSFLAAPEQFAKKERKVKIDGEAYFNVKMNKDWPFVVLVNDLKVSTSGAEFNVKIDNGRVIVTVIDGKVKVEKSEDEFVVLHYGQEVTYDKDAYTFNRNIRADSNLIAYYTKNFNFKNHDLYYVTNIISTAYHKTVIADNNVIDLTITKKIEAQNIESALDIIANDLNIVVKKTDIGYLLSKK